jgi:helicase
MTELIRIKEQPELIETSRYQHAKFPFEKFNPVQSGLFEAFDKDANCIVAASTSAGKTVCAEMFMAYEIRVRKNKAIYLSPLKSLSQEKLDDWKAEHHFSDLNVAICTGDYRLTPDRIKELNEADVIIMTSEMLNSVSRNHRSEKNRWIYRTGLVAIDESHLLGVAGRGDHLESGIMKFTEANSQARLMMLSATMPNVDEVGRWLHHLTGRSTYLLESKYRPCQLNIHYEMYYDDGSYEENERRKVWLTTQLVKKYANDKFICFVHTKKTGEMLLDHLANIGIRCDYHNANLPSIKRIEIEHQFREDPKLRVIIATSGLAQGLNMPARRVVVLGVHRGLSEVDTPEIIQECGRAGRPQYDKEGDAYVLLPKKRFEYHKERLTAPIYIKSQMKNPKVLAFHLVSEIHHGGIKSFKDVEAWYSRTLAHFQKNALDVNVVEEVLEQLSMAGCIREEDDEFSVTPIGAIASMFYYSPFDVSDLNKNFNLLFKHEQADNEKWIAMALANVDSQRLGIVNTTEREEMESFLKEIQGSRMEKALAPKGFSFGALKAGYCFYQLLKGASSKSLSNIMRVQQMDFGRTSEVLSAIDSMGSKWDQGQFFKELKVRIAYGVGVELVELCQLPGIGAAKSKKLYNAGIKKLSDINDATQVIKALKCSKKVADDLIQEAQAIRLGNNT